MVGDKGWVVLALLMVFSSMHPQAAKAQERSSEDRRIRPFPGSDVMRPGGRMRPGVAGGEFRPELNEATRNAAIASRRAAGDASDSGVAVNWENITLKDCIEILCRDLGMEFIISPSVNVAQEVSIRAGDITAWERKDKLEMFDAILETAGVQRIARGRVWVFSPSDIRPIVTIPEGEGLTDGKPIIGVIELKNIDATAAEDFLNSFSGKTKRVFGLKGSRILIVMGTTAYLKQMQELLDIVDVPSSVLMQYILKTADATDVATELSSVFYQRAGSDGSTIQFFPIARLNMVVAHNVPPVLVPEIERWIKMLDRSDGLNERVTKIYRLKVVDAESIGKTLADLYSNLYAQAMDREKELGKTATKDALKKSKKTKNNKSNKNSTGKSGQSSDNRKNMQTTATPTSSSGSSGNDTPASGSTISEEVIILSDKDTNTLIVNAPADMHKEIERTISELDKSRRQVLIETVLVEVTLDETLDLGIEWAVQGSGNRSHSGALISGLDLASLTTDGNPMTKAGDGLTYLLQANDEALALVHAAQEDDRLQVLSSPTVLTRDGMEAEISFGEEVPIQQSSVTDAGKENFSYDYRDAKITLKVTPHIDDFGMVTLDLEQTLRAVNPETVDDEAPKFYTRELRSNLQVDDGQTLILGGLIQRNDQQVRTGIPFLCQLPAVGWLFGRTKTVKVGSEILMILTPHVVDARDETDLLTREFQQKILGAMREKDIRRLFNLQEDPPGREASSANGEEKE